MEIEIRQGQTEKPDWVTYEIDATKKTVKVGVTANGTTNWTPELSKQQLTDLIWYIGEARKEIELGEDVPSPEQLAPRVVFDPKWFTAFLPDRNATMLINNNPFFGPVGFLTPVNHAATLMRLLAAQMEAYIHASASATASRSEDGGQHE